MNNTTLNLPIMNKILESLRIHHVLECKFEKRMRMVQQNNSWNPTGIISPYTKLMDWSHFAVGEGGVIQGGGQHEVANLKQTMRQIWKTVPITGELQRLKSEQFVGVKEEFGQETDSNFLSGLAQNRAIEIILREASMVYSRLKNYYAVQGGDTSAIGVVTGVPSATSVEFSWLLTDQGNRLLEKNMKVQFYDASASALRRLSGDYASPRNESEQYSKVDNKVDRRSTVNLTNNGLVDFDVLPTVSLAAGDTAHVIQGYGALPQGFLYWVNDTGNLLGETGAIARSTNPEVFVSTIQNNSASTANTPALMLAMESFLAGRRGENEPVNLEIWMNKTQLFNHAKFALNSSTGGGSSYNVTRFGDYTNPTRIDVGVPMMGNSFNNVPIEYDSDVPPSKNLWIDWLGWMLDVETPDTIYEYHSDQQFYQSHNSYGEPIDQKQVTLFSQYNYRCTNFKTQGFQDDLAYDAAHIGQV